jgi:hypothetical protein
MYNSVFVLAEVIDSALGRGWGRGARAAREPGGVGFWIGAL